MWKECVARGCEHSSYPVDFPLNEADREISPADCTAIGAEKMKKRKEISTTEAGYPQEGGGLSTPVGISRP